MRADRSLGRDKACHVDSGFKRVSGFHVPQKYVLLTFLQGNLPRVFHSTRSVQLDRRVVAIPLVTTMILMKQWNVTSQASLLKCNLSSWTNFLVAPSDYRQISRLGKQDETWMNNALILDVGLGFKLVVLM